MLKKVELKKAEEERDAIIVEDEDDIREYYELRQVLKEKGADFQAVITHPTYALPFLNAGRLVEIRDGDRDFEWGIVVAYNKVQNPKVCRMARVCSGTNEYRADHPSLRTKTPLKKDTLLMFSSSSHLDLQSRAIDPLPASIRQ